MKQVTKRLVLGLGAMVLLGGALFLALRPRAVLVETQPVTRGRFEAVVEEDGRTRLRERYIVSAPVGGRVLRPALRAGDTVAPGDLAAVILAPPSTLLGPRARREAAERVGAAEAMLQQAAVLEARATAQQAQATADAARVRALHASGVAPAQQRERADLAEQSAMRDRQSAERRRHAAEHELDQARALLLRADAPDNGSDRLEVRVPVAGRVLRVLQESEAVVPAGAPLLELGDPADLEVVVDVLTTEVVGISPGTPVAIERWGGPAPLEGRVRLVEPGAFTKVSALGVEEQRVWVVIDITTPRAAWAKLGDGFRVDARITVAAVEDAVLVPVSALFRRGVGWAAFVASDGEARERGVEIAGRSGPVAMVASGLAPGEVVVAYPPGSLRDGMRLAR